MTWSCEYTTILLDEGRLLYTWTRLAGHCPHRALQSDSEEGFPSRHATSTWQMTVTATVPIVPSASLPWSSACRAELVPLRHTPALSSAKGMENQAFGIIPCPHAHALKRMSTPFQEASFSPLEGPQPPNFDVKRDLDSHLSP